MKLASVFLSAAIALGAAMPASAKSVTDFAYYHVGCYATSTGDMMWYEIADTSSQIRSIIQRCTADGGQFRIQKIYYR
ncbi:hypothetical protein [Pseudoalteromonas sp. Of7M-16]|uniref:hypothetical protein n=1 Tax=Pseudoalteromonas sp. Of7M-16 TaxID=2917756 RepID=UPI001EF5958D|nr:hypothetical protein [Pseudoalteromonas sp. Of7M-16]MCG7551081.1 hypothetical protein [Pseudoalteromonas sp. Of7M-16]